MNLSTSDPRWFLFPCHKIDCLFTFFLEMKDFAAQGAVVFFYHLQNVSLLYGTKIIEVCSELERLDEGLGCCLRDSTLAPWTPWAPEGLVLSSDWFWIVQISTKSHFFKHEHIQHTDGPQSARLTDTSSASKLQEPQWRAQSSLQPCPWGDGSGTVLITWALCLENEAQQLLFPSDAPGLVFCEVGPHTSV